MSKYIYRYVSLATLLNVVQTKALCFVLPDVWEDVYENKFLDNFFNSLEPDNPYVLFRNLFYAQCWTYLDESDAMWRIYNYDNQSLRIKIDLEDVEKLENVNVVPVEYNDDSIDYKSLYPNLTEPEIILKSIAQKRVAFAHEKEVRLIYFEKKEYKEIESAILTSLVLTTIKENKDKNVIINSEDSVKLDTDKLLYDMHNFNFCANRKSHSVSFSHINGFIKGIMVHPFAPDWYVKTIEKFCQFNDIPFEEKSKLYQLN